jgi:transposase
MRGRGLAVLLVDQEHIDRRVVDLHQFERKLRVKRRCVDRCKVLPRDTRPMTSTRLLAFIDRLGKLLLRRGLHYRGCNWTPGHQRWIDSLTWAHPAERVVVDDYLLALEQLGSRFSELDRRLADIAESEPYRERVGWLRCFRGIDTLTAILILAELHEFRRFPSPRALMAFLGLVPGEHSSGEKHRRGRITRTGNTLVRRLLRRLDRCAIDRHTEQA